MNRRSFVCLCCGAAALSPVFGTTLFAGSARAQSKLVSAADHAFIMKVSQGGMYEVEASKLAVDKARQQDVIDTSVFEVHDHQLVGAKLTSIATALDISFPTTLNAMFQQRLDRLNSTPAGAAFDAAYIKEMEAIHAVDVLAFADEAKSGQNPDLRAFAAETVRIVRRHIGSLHAVPLPTA